MKKRLLLALISVILVLALSGCAVINTVCSILGIDAKDYSDEEKIADVEPDSETAAVLLQIAENRGCVKKGGEADYAKAAELLLGEFRSGRLGRITLERPKEG